MSNETCLNTQHIEYFGPFRETFVIKKLQDRFFLIKLDKVTQETVKAISMKYCNLVPTIRNEKCQPK